jgi:hypothetical protein
MQLTQPSLAVALTLLAPLLSAAAPQLKPTVLGDDDYAESFTFVADLDDGTYLQLQLAVTNIGPGERTGACRALLVRPGKAPWTRNERVGSEEWRHSGDAAYEKLDVGPCEAVSGGATEVVARLDGAVISLRYPTPVSAVVPPSGVLQVGSRKHSTWLLHPFSTVTAKLALPGQPAVELSGGGYADHSRTNVSSKALARRWIRFRGLRGGERVLLLARESLSGGFDPAWIWIEGRAPQRFERFDLARAGTRERPSWTVHLSGGRGGEISSLSLLYRYAPVEELGAIGRIVKPFVGSPVTYTHRAELRLNGEAALYGILEVSLLEE